MSKYILPASVYRAPGRLCGIAASASVTDEKDDHKPEDKRLGDRGVMAGASLWAQKYIRSGWNCVQKFKWIFPLNIIVFLDFSII